MDHTYSQQKDSAVQAVATSTGLYQDWSWLGPQESVVYNEEGIQNLLLSIEQPLWVVSQSGRVGVTAQGSVSATPANGGPASRLLAALPAQPIETLGDPAFQSTYKTRFSYYAGAMANAIASENLVITMGRAGLMASFGAGGCPPARVESAINKIIAALPDGPYAFNLLNSPNEPSIEQRAAEFYVKYHVPVVEASAYLDITYALAYYRLAGLSLAPDGQIQIGNRIIAKLSRKEVARRFMSPAPQDLVARLLQEGKISEQQANMAQNVPMADDVTVEADSGGHTDNRPLVCLMPTMLALRDELQARYNYTQPIRVGAAGGISTPHSALAALMMGAAYIATGSVNQSCVEAGASEHTRNLLAQADMADVAMAPSADMFEMGVKVQVLKRGTMFAPRASKLYEYYNRYASWEEIPLTERQKLETTVFKRTFEDIWADTVRFFMDRDPKQIERANNDARQKMALVFRWYLGLSSRWSNSGEKGREMDYQVWCGPSMGSFNDWVRGTYLEAPANRQVVDVAFHILNGAAYLSRLRMLSMQGIQLPSTLASYIPKKSFV